MITEINDVKTINKGQVLIDFYTPTCMPCKAISPILEEISREFKNLMVGKVNVAQCPDMGQMFGIMSVPTVIFMEDCKVKQVLHGMSNKEKILAMVRECIDD
jgi:thioredoxin 1